MTYHTDHLAPFWIRVAESLHYHLKLPPTFASERRAHACVYFNSDGVVGGIKLMSSSGDDELDAAAQQALEAFRQARSQVPEQLPTAGRDRMAAMMSWNCFLLGSPRSP